MPFWTTAQPTDRSCQEGLEDAEYVEPPAMIAVQAEPSPTKSARSGSRFAATAVEDDPRPGCCARLRSELNPCQPWFTTADTFGRKVDIPESFSPPSCYAFLWKVAATGLTIATLVLTWIDTDNPQFYLAYLTYWALLLSALYTPCSLWNTIMAARTPQPPVAAGCFIRTTWALFTMAAHAEAMASILYWVLIYVPGETHLTFYNLTPHVVIACVVWWDGLVVNRIPVRWMHWYGFVLPLELGWVVWSLVQAYAGIGNPDHVDVQGVVDDDADDTAIYTALSWKDDWVRSLVTVLLAVFVLGPLLFLLLWLCSLYTIPCFCYKERRKYLDSYKDEADPRPTVDDVEEGSIFARWR